MQPRNVGKTTTALRAWMKNNIPREQWETTDLMTIPLDRRALRGQTGLPSYDEGGQVAQTGLGNSPPGRDGSAALPTL